MNRELKPIIDDSWFASPECDALLEAAERKGTRRVSGRAMARTRSFRRRRAVVWPWVLGGLAMVLFMAMVIGESMGAVS